MNMVDGRETLVSCRQTLNNDSRSPRNIESGISYSFLTVKGVQDVHG